MALRAHRLSDDDAFLAERRTDPVAGRVFEPGDLVVVCAACRTPMLAETWVVLGGAHCGQAETSGSLPGDRNEPAQERTGAPELPPGQAPAVPEGSRRRTSLTVATLALVVLVAVLAVYGVTLRRERTSASARANETALIPLDPPPPPVTAEPEVGDLHAAFSGGPTSPAAYPPGTVLVDSPGDGFLALRSQPSADQGERVTTMPHGAAVRVLGSCVHQQTISGRPGAWCQIDYDGVRGWAFSGFLVTPPTDIIM